MLGVYADPVIGRFTTYFTRFLSGGLNFFCNLSSHVYNYPVYYLWLMCYRMNLHPLIEKYFNFIHMFRKK